jgi:hypothetical protein
MKPAATPARVAAAAPLVAKAAAPRKLANAGVDAEWKEF